MPTKKKPEIKKLEKKYFVDGFIKIPVPPRTKNYGQPLFRIELIRGKKLRNSYVPIVKIILGIPHLEKEGYTAWRYVDCHTGSVDMGGASRWNLHTFCTEHPGGIRIEMYPPTVGQGAESRPCVDFLTFDYLFSGVSSSLRWMKANGEVVRE